jgi:predicted NBD/HSP70 family sugar kinase
VDDIVLIGIDGGASKVLAHRVEILSDPLRFSPVEPSVEVSYDSSELYELGFEPVALQDQLAEHRAGSVQQVEREERRESAILDSFLRAVSGLDLAGTSAPIVIGIGLPGLKTPDKRGISAMANGPRMPRFLDKLEALLKAQGLSTVEPVHALGSDADYCGLGEQWGTAGSMRGIENAYYLGIGTGVADAMLLSGKIVPFDATKSWMAKTWEIMYTETLSFENMVSAQGMQRRYSVETGLSLDELNNRQVFPWQIFERALAGEASAAHVALATAEALGRLLVSRIVTLARGLSSVRLIDTSRVMSADHPYLGGVFDRIVIGQRLGDIWGHPEFRPVFSDRVEERLVSELASADLPLPIVQRYLDDNGRLRPGLIVHSELRNAPALGAAVDAYLNRTQ